MLELGNQSGKLIAGEKGRGREEKGKEGGESEIDRKTDKRYRYRWKMREKIE